jgi:23S rRNA (adenine2503-C2)-methyltransferase
MHVAQLVLTFVRAFLLQVWRTVFWLHNWSLPATADLAASPTPISSKPLPQPQPPTDGLQQEQLLEHTQASLAKAVLSRLGRGEALARALYRAYFSSHGDLRLAVDSVPELRQAHADGIGAQLLGLLDGTLPLQLVGPVVPPVVGETRKYVLRCTSGEEVEMVAMPAPGARGGWSLCVSSQVGCRMGCTFCETGRMGLLRNLTVGEIVAQAAHAALRLRLRPLANVIFMGMGEPLDNVHAVIGAIRVLTDPAGLAVPLSHITISTSGEAQHVYTLLEAVPTVRIAFSVHAANEALRSQLMPINRRVPLNELAAAMRFYLEQTKRRVTVQYVLLAGVNTSPRHAEELATFLATIGPTSRLHLNLIPYNPQSGAPRFEAPSHDECKDFKTDLQQRGIFVKIREEKGADQMAACGQLGNVNLRRELNKRRLAEYEDADLQAPAVPTSQPPAVRCGSEALAW